MKVMGIWTGGGPCHLYGGGAPHHQINTRACGHTSMDGQKIKEISNTTQAQKEPSLEMHRCDELNRVGVAQLQDETNLNDGVREMFALAPGRDVNDADLAPGRDMCDDVLAPARGKYRVALAPGHGNDDTTLAPGCEKINDRYDICEELVSVDQLPRCDVRGGRKYKIQNDERVVQIGQNVEVKATQNEVIGRRNVQKSFPIFSSTLVFSNRKKDKQSATNNIPRGKGKSILDVTPSKIRKLCIESNTITCNFETKPDYYPREEIIVESPAKRRKLDIRGQSTKMAENGD